MTRIPSDLARYGLKVELTPGWETRGSSSFAPGGVTCHWTAGPKGTTGRPSLNICINGRTGIPGPLCNIYLARDGTCVVVAAGRANHAGVGGYKGLVGNSAVYGIEAESGGDGDWTAAQRAAYPRLVAALLSGLGRDASWSHGHHEWAPTRKIDIRDIMGSVRSDAAKILAGGTPSNPGGNIFMALNDAQQVELYLNQQAIRSMVGNIHAWMRGGDPNVDNFTLLWQMIADVQQTLKGATPEDGDRLADIWTAIMSLTALAAKDPETPIDVDALAAKVVEAMGKDLAGDFVDELSERLKAQA